MTPVGALFEVTVQDVLEIVNGHLVVGKFLLLFQTIFFSGGHHFVVLIRGHIILIDHIVITLLLFGALSASRFLHLNLHLESLLFLPLLFLFAVFVKFNLVLDFLLVEELNTLIEDIQMHLNNFWLFHEADVLIRISAGLAFFRACPSGGLVRLLRIEVH